jgi:purine-binding chemotaxis protein CheW
VSERDPLADAAALRRAFDDSFAQPPQARGEPPERLLLVELDGEGYALRLADVAGLAASRPITPIPSRAPALLGLAGLRGNLVPVYALAPLLGRAAAPEGPRWLVTVRGEEPLGLAFATFVGYAELPAADFAAVGHDDRHPDGAARRAHVRSLVRARGRIWAVIDMPSLVAAVQQRCEIAGGGLAAATLSQEE